MSKVDETVKSIALEILDQRLHAYLKFDSPVSKQYLFVCMFTEPIGIHIHDAPIKLVETNLKHYNHKIIDDIQKRIYNEIGTFETIYLIYFILFHEEAHFLEFLESGLKPLEYCKQIDLSSYNGRLLDIKDPQAFDVAYRATDYEKRADDYAIRKLKELVT